MRCARALWRSRRNSQGPGTFSGRTKKIVRQPGKMLLPLAEHCHSQWALAREESALYGINEFEVMKIVSALLLLLTIVLPAFSLETYEQRVHRFDYDPKAPLDIQDTGVQNRDGIQVQSLSYASLK